MTIKELEERTGLLRANIRFYEEEGLLSPVRLANGYRDYSEEDLNWVELAKCMRSAGITVEAMIEYVSLFQQGDSTISARLQLLVAQRESLLEQRRQIDITLKRLNYKISRYEEAARTGILRWEAGGDCRP